MLFVENCKGQHIGTREAHWQHLPALVGVFVDHPESIYKNNFSWHHNWQLPFFELHIQLLQEPANYMAT